MEKHMWLTSLFFNNTIQILKMGNNKALSEKINSNYMDSIDIYFDKVEKLMVSMIVPKSENDVIFKSEKNNVYNLLYELYYSCWASDVERHLCKLLSYLEINKDVRISEDSLMELKRYRKSLILKTRFGEDSIKKYRQYYSKRKTWGDEQSKIFIYKALVPFFENQIENINAFKKYIEWMQSPENYFQTLKGERVYQGSADERNELSALIEQYIGKNGFEYVKEDFVSLIFNVFKTLDNISQTVIKNGSVDLKAINNELEFFYNQSIRLANTIIYLSLSEIISSLIKEAIEDTIATYSNIQKRRNWGWSECKNHLGFQVQMLYYLYYRLYSYEESNNSQMKQLGIDLYKYAFKKYQTCISPTAVISTAAYIKDNCYIKDRVVVKENVLLNNCTVEQDVTINADSTIDVLNAHITENSILSKNTSIEGDIYITIKSGKD